ncbi:PTS glucose transporter subunit IIA [Lactobacillus juensis]|uniref:PTS sugar transporter subunit IIA n=1 Tax=Lactobacillus juensis TaxID=3082862 RepID=UPI0030C776B8
MLSFFKKKEENLKITAPVDGELVPITEVKDDIFSKKMLGDGFAIKPNSDDLYSPVKGIISSIFSTKHALGIKTENGLEILLHFGIDTVELEGKPFSIKVKEKEKVLSNDYIGTMNRSMVEKEQKDDIVIVVFTNLNEGIEFPQIINREIKHGEEIGQIKVKNK